MQYEPRLPKLLLVPLEALSTWHSRLQVRGGPERGSGRREQGMGGLVGLNGDAGEGQPQALTAGRARGRPAKACPTHLHTCDLINWPAADLPTGHRPYKYVLAYRTGHAEAATKIPEGAVPQAPSAVAAQLDYKPSEGETIYAWLHSRIPHSRGPFIHSASATLVGGGGSAARQQQQQQR